ncbi:MAG TPA: serine/threonine-protein kinase [Myxococcaceae bacterium]|nr:serine/threonine-protein kinase [Myxococcaceae bacterium]
MTRLLEQPPYRLASGTQVGPWRVEALQGQGAFGAVYRAVRLGQEAAGPVALKVAHYAWDARFGREAELLSRLSHPGIPRLLERGVLRHGAPEGEYPYLVMEWVEGVPLYTWAERHAPSSQQVCQVLAQVARALEALHAAGAVHRDVKGDNVLVRLSDNQPFLIDFGSCHFQGAPRITWQSLAPFTPEYLSAQACLFDLRLARHCDSYYEPTPADDVYALGVTAYRLVMGQYPPPMQVSGDGPRAWQVKSLDPRPQLESHPRLGPRLRELIVQLLSDAAEVRGTAAQAAEALEAIAAEPLPRHSAEPLPAAQVPPPSVPVPAGERERTERDRPPSRTRTLSPWLALAAAGACGVLLWSSQPGPVPPSHVSASPPQAADFHVPDAGPSAVGDTSPTEPRSTPPSTSEKKPIAQEPLPELRAGQLRPDGKGRCLARRHVAINGGCWLEFPSISPEECTASGYVLFEGKCLSPALESPKKPSPTSSPPEAR